MGPLVTVLLQAVRCGTSAHSLESTGGPSLPGRRHHPGWRSRVPFLTAIRLFNFLYADFCQTKAKNSQSVKSILLFFSTSGLYPVNDSIIDSTLKFATSAPWATVALGDPGHGGSQRRGLGSATQHLPDFWGLSLQHCSWVTTPGKGRDQEQEHSFLPAGPQSGQHLGFLLLRPQAQLPQRRQCATPEPGPQSRARTRQAYVSASQWWPGPSELCHFKHVVSWSNGAGQRASQVLLHRQLV